MKRIKKLSCLEETSCSVQVDVANSRSESQRSGRLGPYPSWWGPWRFLPSPFPPFPTHPQAVCIKMSRTRLACLKLSYRKSCIDSERFTSLQLAFWKMNKSTCGLCSWLLGLFSFKTNDCIGSLHLSWWCCTCLTNSLIRWCRCRVCFYLCSCTYGLLCYVFTPKIRLDRIVKTGHDRCWNGVGLLFLHHRDVCLDCDDGSNSSSYFMTAFGTVQVLIPCVQNKTFAEALEWALSSDSC